MRKTTRKVAFLPTVGFLTFDFNIFYCNTSCLVYLPTQHRRKPIQGTDRSFHPETGVYGWISSRCLVNHAGEICGDSGVKSRHITSYGVEYEEGCKPTVGAGFRVFSSTSETR